MKNGQGREGARRLSWSARTVCRPTYRRLDQMLELASESQSQLVFAAMPMAKPYEIPKELQNILESSACTFIDCRDVSGITAEMIPDGVHINEAAAQVYSRYPAQRLPLRPRNETTSSITLK